MTVADEFVRKADKATLPGNVVQALSRVMADLPAIGKTRGEGLGYAFRGIEAITGHVQPLFARYGVVFVPSVQAHEVREITVNNKPWTDMTLTVTYTVYGPGGVDDHITVGPFIGIGRDNSDKGANKAMTQCLKYALLQVLCISDKSDDADGITVEADIHTPVKRFNPTDEAKVNLATLIGELPEDERVLAKSHLRGRFGDPAQMHLAQVQEAIAIILNWPPPTGGEVDGSEAP